MSGIKEIDVDGGYGCTLNNCVAVVPPNHFNFRLRSGMGTCCPRAVMEPYLTLEQVESFSKKVQGDDSGEN